MSISTFDGENWTKITTIPKRAYYRVAEVALILDTQVPNIYHIIKRGTLKAYKVEGIKMVAHEDLREYHAKRLALLRYK